MTSAKAPSGHASRPITMTASPGETVRLNIPETAPKSDARRFSWSVVTGSTAGSLSNVENLSATFTAAEPGTCVVVAIETGGDEVHFVILVAAITIILKGPATGSPNHIVTLTATVSGAPDNAMPNWSAVADNPDATSPLVFDDGLSARILPGDVGPITVTFTLSLPNQVHVTRTYSIDVVAADTEEFDPTDAAWWQDKQKSDTREALSNIVAAAGRWQGYGTALLSVFSTVALLSGPTTLKETDNIVLNWIVVGVMCLAFVLAFLGLLRLSQVTSQAPQLGAGRTAQTFATEYYEAAALAQSRFRGSKSLTVVAAALIGVSSLALVVVAAQAEAEADNKNDPPLVIVRTTSETLCGELSTGRDGTISVAGKKISRSSSIVAVDSCG